MSVFVAANAGSGKTSLLTRRVLGLLLHGVEPQRILCLTFTNAAAAEMSNRILKELGRWVMADAQRLADELRVLAEREPDEALMNRARGLFAYVLESPEGVRIQTIHGFCQALLRRFPLEAEVSPHFSVMDTRSEQEMAQEAKLRLFNRANNDKPVQDAISALAQRLGEEGFSTLLREIVQEKLAFSSLFQKPGGIEGAVSALWRRACMKEGMTLAQLVAEHFAYDEATLADLRTVAGILSQGEKTDLTTGQGLAKWLENPGEAALIDAYELVFLNLEHGRRERLFKKDSLTDPALVAAMIAEQERVWRFRQRRLSLELTQMSANVLMVAGSLLEIYEGLKRAHAHMDYDDLILTARTLLSRPGISAWVLFKLDGGIDHVMVDEAQDTNPEQWAIIDALTHDFFSGLGRKTVSRSLFVVGDEKQSIFSFQGADVQALGGMQRYFRQRIADAQMQSRTVMLARSFRSVPQVLGAVDAIFASAQARSGLMFEDSVLTHIPTRVKEGGLVELWPLLVPEENNARSPATLLARTLADTIGRWVDEGVAQPSDIMVLVRTRTGFVDALVRALKRRGVAVAGADRMKLGNNLAVKDLLALGQWLLLAEDDLILSALLKSPMLGIEEDMLFTLCWDRGGRSVWERMQAHGDCAEMVALLSGLRAKADFISPYELYAHALDTLGLRRRITGRMGEEYNDPIDEFLMQALLYEQGNIPGLQGFLHWMTASESQIKRDMEQSKDCVRIMTVHGSKGLQAPVVILPDTVSMPDMHEKLWWDDELPLWSPGKAYDDARAGELRREGNAAMLAEYRRLLYVALTRAEDRLYICGASSGTKLNEQCWYSLVKSGLSSVAAACQTPAGEGLRLGDAPVPRAKEKPAIKTAQATDFTFLHAAPPDEPLPPKPLSPSRPLEDEPSAASPLSNGAVYARGTAIHILLQYLPPVAPKRREAAARHLIKPYGVTEDCVHEALRLLDDPRYAFLFAPTALAEVPVAGTVMFGGRPVAVAGQIDRLAIGDTEVWLVDYKTNRLPPEQMHDIPAAYRRQMALYRAVVAHIYPQKAIRCALLWTAAPRLDVLDEALLDEAVWST